MKSLNGWQRLAIVLTFAWAVRIFLFSLYEYQEVTSGKSPTKFIQLEDTRTKKDLGNLPLAEVKEFGQLAREKGMSPAADPEDAKTADFLLAAVPEARLRVGTLITWISLPLILLWAFLIGTRWIAVGFSKP